MLDYQTFDARIKINFFQLKHLSTAAKFLTDALLKEFRPEVDEKKEIEFRQKSKN